MGTIRWMMFIGWSVTVGLRRHRRCWIESFCTAHWWTPTRHRSNLVRSRWAIIIKTFIHTRTIFPMPKSALFTPRTFVNCLRVITAFDIDFLYWADIDWTSSRTVHVARTSWKVIHLGHHDWWHSTIVARWKSIIVVSRKLVLIWGELCGMHTRVRLLTGRKVSSIMIIRSMRTAIIILRVRIIMKSRITISR